MEYEELQLAWNNNVLDSMYIDSSTGDKNIKNINRAYFEEGVKSNSYVFNEKHRCFLGAYSYLNAGGYVKNSFIGRYCSVGQRVSIGAAAHRIDRLSTHPQLGGGHVKKTLIDCDVWIGDGVVILAGVHIGHGAVIGANSVVTRDVDSYSMVAGVPARHLRYRFEDKIRSSLLDSKWWNLPFNFLKELQEFDLEAQIDLINGYSGVDSNFVVYSYNL